MTDQYADHHTDTPIGIDRVSIRTVLVREGEDPGAALAVADLVDPIALPVMSGEQPDVPGGILGNGITPNVTALLETEQPDVSGEASKARSGSVRSADRRTRTSEPASVVPPAASGIQSLAPVRKIAG